MRSSQSEVEGFLEMVRDAIDRNCYTFIPRSKNRITMSRYGLLPTDITDEIYKLTYNNYIEGPEPDHDPNEEDPVWVFKSFVIDTLFYIKIKIVINNDNHLKILSFHIDFMD